jgi:hypothetical protein
MMVDISKTKIWTGWNKGTFKQIISTKQSKVSPKVRLPPSQVQRS